MAKAASFFVWNALPKILHVIPTLERGGAERSLAHLVTSTAGTGNSFNHKVATFAPGGVFRDQIEAAGVDVATLGVASAAGFPLGVWRLQNIIRQWRPDVVQGWLYYGDLAATVARALAGDPRPRLFWNIRCSDLDFSAYHPILKMAAKLEARLSSFPHAIIVNSNVGKQAHVALGFRSDKFVLIHNGVDTEKFTPDQALREAVRSQLGLGASDKMVLHAGRVDPQKNHEMLIKIATQLPHHRFFAAGRGTEALIGPKNLTLLGDQKNISDLMNAADLMLSTSSYGEGFPNVIAEAMACGTPAVSTDCGDANEIIGEFGTIIEKNDVEAGIVAIEAAFSRPDQAHIEMGESVRERILENFSLNKCRAGFESVWQSI